MVLAPWPLIALVLHGASVVAQPEYEFDDLETVETQEPVGDQGTLAPELESPTETVAEPTVEPVIDGASAAVVESESEAATTEDVAAPAVEVSEAGLEPATAPSEALPAALPPPPTVNADHDADDEATTDSPKDVVRSRAREFADHLHIGGFIQVDFLWRQISRDELSDGTREPLNETGFLLRNARLGVDAEWQFFGVTAYADFFSRGEGVRPTTVDVHAQWPGKKGKPPLVQLRAGMLRVPFGFENYNQNDVQRFFGERSMVMDAYVPGLFDVGASLGGHIWAVDWVVGAYNGQPVGAPGFAYRDPNRAKDIAGRVQLGGDLAPGLGASLGFSFLTGKGFSAGTAPTKDTFDWVDLNEDGRITLAELLPVAGSAGRPSENFKRWGLAGDVQLTGDLPTVGPLTAYAELAVGSNLDRAVAIADPVLLGRDQRGIGWYVGLTQALTRHAAVGIRFDQYYPNLDELEAYEGVTVNTRRKFQTIDGGVAAYLHRGELAQARLLFEYEHQWNSLGRDAQGRPAQLGNDTFRTRAEVAF